MTKNRKKLDPFPREVLVQHYVDVVVDDGIERREAWLNAYPSEVECFDHDPGNSGPAAGTRVAVYRLVEIVTLTRKETITRKKRREKP